jgi:ABC-type transport system involved in multi-copper enzyme maturation permease subunit
MFEPSDALSWGQWTAGAFLSWLLVVLWLAGAGLLIGWLVAALRGGPVSATRAAWRVLVEAWRDLTRISPRRIAALSWLTVKESIRRRVLVVFAVFVLILLFAGWFLDPGSPDPARLYLSVVLTTTSYLVLLLALLLSALSLPADIRNRTLHTVVTKPVRQSEIVLGRMLGFTVVGTGLLGVMGVVSYVFVIRGLTHTHELTAADLRPVEGAAAEGPHALRGRTSSAYRHRHEVYIDPTGAPRVAMEQGHWHELSIEGSGERATYRLGPPQGMLVARVPVYGKLRFKDRSGQDVEKGVSVGDEWTYRSFVAGGTLATAIWTFSGISEKDFPDGLPVELTIEVFRTHKGEIEKGIPGSLSVRNPRTGRMVKEVRIFTAKKFAIDVQPIPRALQTPQGQNLDLFQDLVSDGQVEIWLRCMAPEQYFGAAQADLYLRARDAPFWLNFAKSYLGIWLQMVLVIGFGVMFSTFLSGPIAMLATAAALILGMYSEFVSDLARHMVIGGGPMEAAIRTLGQQNLITELEPGLKTTVAQMADKVLELGLAVVSAILPDFGRFSFPDAEGRLAVATGFDIAPQTILKCVCQALGFLVPLVVAGYFFLKHRELSQ